jgi:glutamate N-acetyltransferase/amino-acid N-acetyltransferase
MEYLDGGLEMVPGYRFSAVECGIRRTGRLDYCLIASEGLCNAAGVFTTNRIAAAPVKLCRERIGGPIKALLANATNANACTGEQGYTNAERLTRDVADRLGAPPASILMASTGIIGRQLPVEKMMRSHPALVSSLAPDNGGLIPLAIMTTDTAPKRACVSFETGRGKFRIAGAAKGAGMIAPNMATLLCFMITDAPVPRSDLEASLRRSVDATLNAITIDGDMSTNDTALILSPQSDTPVDDARGLENFEEALHALLARISEMLIADGEGATKSVKIVVKNARTREDAALIARTIAESMLVKTAFFGNDPNWGRIAAAAGYSGAEVEESALSIFIDGSPLFQKGTPSDPDPASIADIMRKNAFTVTVDIGLGEAEASMLTTDLSVDYVKINAEYST